MSLRISSSSSDQSGLGPIHHGSYSVKNRVAYSNSSINNNNSSNIILWCNSSSNNNIGYGTSKTGNNSKWMQPVVLCPCRPRLPLSPPEWLRLILRVSTCIMAVSIISGIQLTSAHLRLYNYKGNSSGCINSNTIFNNNSSSKWSTTICPLGLLSQALVAPNASRANVIPNNNSQWVTRLIHLLLLHLLCPVRCTHSSSHSSSLTPPLYATDHRCDTTTINYAIFSKRAYEKFGFFCLSFLLRQLCSGWWQCFVYVWPRKCFLLYWC